MTEERRSDQQRPTPQQEGVERIETEEDLTYQESGRQSPVPREPAPAAPAPRDDRAGRNG
jgi:hypothetical protein